MEPSQKVFNNSTIVKCIMDHIPASFLMHQLDYRLINTTFRNAFDDLLRKWYRTLSITHDCRGQYSEVFFGKMYINDEEVKIQHLFKFLEYLKSALRVTVKEVRINNCFLLNDELQCQIHDYVVKELIGDKKSEVEVFTGMDNICHPGCKDCLEIAKQCYEYGPVQLNYLITQPTIPKHFKKLIITDYLLDDIANECVESKTMNTLNKMITSDISCDILQLNISSCRRRTMEILFREVKEAMPMPREILDAILLKWNVNSIILKFVNLTRLNYQEGAWLKAKWFKGFRFNDDFRYVYPSSLDFKFQKVEVDFSASSIRSERLKEGAVDRFFIIPSNQNLIPNIRQVFPTDRLSIRFCQWTALKVPYVFDRLSTQIFKDDYYNLEVDIQLIVNDRKGMEFAHSGDIDDMKAVVDKKLKLVRMENLFDIVFKCRKYNETTGLYCYRLENHVGKKCRLSNRYCSINLEILTREYPHYLDEFRRIVDESTFLSNDYMYDS
ncbi:unnamed protein product [Caenorhabditis nigoni]